MRVHISGILFIRSVSLRRFVKAWSPDYENPRESFLRNREIVDIPIRFYYRVIARCFFMPTSEFFRSACKREKELINKFTMNQFQFIRIEARKKFTEIGFVRTKARERLYKLILSKLRSKEKINGFIKTDVRRKS